jgi:hypothetical protein
MNQPAVGALAFLICALGTAADIDTKTAYPAMAPIARYRMASLAEEIAMSRSAAPAAISDNASIQILGDRGYETAVTGSNGFVCMVQRAWASAFDDAGFWNPKLRGPICFNAAAARTVLPAYLERTAWVIGGVSKAEMTKRTSAELAANRIATPDPGAMSYMMSKQGYLGDSVGHWHPHLMFFFGRADRADWGADLHGSPIFAARDESESVTTFFVLVPTWSDGSPAAMDRH